MDWLPSQETLDKFRTMFGIPTAGDRGLKQLSTSASVAPTKQKPVDPRYLTANPTKKQIYAYEKAMAEYEPEKWLKGHRYDPKTDSLETLPLYIEKGNLDTYMKAYKAGLKYGLSPVTPEEFAAMLVQEKRGNLGFNGFDTVKAPFEAFDVYSSVNSEVRDAEAAGFVGLLKEKQMAAKRKGIPLARAWNGTGVNKYGQTGSEYAKEVQRTKELMQDPKNKEIIEYFRKQLGVPVKKAELDSFDYNDPFGDSVA